jgi:hypothetical protein
MISEEEKQMVPMKNILLLLFMVISLASCKKDVGDLPGPTQTGSNTFGARVNGRLWVPQGFGIVPTAPILEATYRADGGIIRIVARNFGSSPTETEMEILLKGVYGAGTYQLDQNTSKYPAESANYGYYIERRFMPKNEWITNSGSGGRVVVTRFDQANRIISGTFDFTATSMDSTASALTVSEGRFDVTMQ